MDGIWAVVIVAALAFVFAFAALLILARTTWHAMRHRAELDQIAAATPRLEQPPRPNQLHRTPLSSMQPHVGGIPLESYDEEESEG